MRNKVFYTTKGTSKVLRPYLEVNFLHAHGYQAATQGCLVDTGADSFLIPYTLGKYLGLTYKYAELDNNLAATGVGGSINTVKRIVTITIDHSHSGKKHTKDVAVSWLVPTEEEHIRLENLRKKFKSAEKDSKNALQRKKEYEECLVKFEQEPLIGRDFMKNFVFLTFVNERDDSKSYFEYEMRPV